MLTEPHGVRSQKSWRIHGGRSTTFSMRLRFADRCFTPLWRLAPNLYSLPSQMCPSGNQICPSPIPRSPNPALPNHRRKLTRPRRPNGIHHGQRSFPMALESVFGTTSAPVVPARRVAMHTSAPFRNPMVNHAQDFTWLRSTQRHPTDRDTILRNLFCPRHCHHQTSPFRKRQCQCLWTDRFRSQTIFHSCPIFQRLVFSLTFSQVPPAQLAQL